MAELCWDWFDPNLKGIVQQKLHTALWMQALLAFSNLQNCSEVSWTNTTTTDSNVKSNKQTNKNMSARRLWRMWILAENRLIVLLFSSKVSCHVQRLAV